MTTDRRETTHFPRLNPFAFPSDTDFRFVLLLVVVIATSLLIYTLLYNNIPFNWQRLQAIEAQCAAAAMERYPTNSLPDQMARTAAENQCTASFYQEQALTVLGGVVLLLTVAGVIYMIYPSWKIRHDKLKPLVSDVAPDLADSLAKLCNEAQLVSPPQFLLQPRSQAVSGLAFGRRGRYYVVLNGGLVTKFSKDEATFREIVLHELAHLRNADVDKTYFSLAVGIAFLLLALLPLLIVLLIEAPLGSILNIGGHILVQAAVIYLAILAILRAREIYADVRASYWDGPAGRLSCVLEKLPPQKGLRWLYLLRLHPDVADRRTLLDQTDRLFPLGFWEAFIVGYAVALVVDIVDIWVGELFPTPSFLSSLVTGALFGLLIVGVVGVGIWRATFVAMVRRKSPAGLSRLGMGIGLGFLFGECLSLYTYAAIKSGETLTGYALLIFVALWLPLVLLGFSAVVHWIAAGASTWLEVAIRSRSPRLVYRLVLSVVSLWLAVVVAALIFSRSLYDTGKLSVDAVDYLSHIAITPIPALSLALLLMNYLVLNPFTLLVLVCLWAIPLSAWFWRKRINQPAQVNGAFLEPSSDLRGSFGGAMPGEAASQAAGGNALRDAPPVAWEANPCKKPTCERPSSVPLDILPYTSLRLGLALAIGTLGGLLASVLLLSLGVLVILVSPDASMWLVIGQVLAAALMQVVIALVATCWIKRLGSLHGLCAAFMSGCILTIGALFTLFLYMSMLRTPLHYSLTSLIWDFFSSIVNGGALLSLPVVLLVSLFMRRKRQN